MSLKDIGKHPPFVKQKEIRNLYPTFQTNRMKISSSEFVIRLRIKLVWCWRDITIDFPLETFFQGENKQPSRANWILSDSKILYISHNLFQSSPDSPRLLASVCSEDNPLIMSKIRLITTTEIQNKCIFSIVATRVL